MARSRGCERSRQAGEQAALAFALPPASRRASSTASNATRPPWTKSFAWDQGARRRCGRDAQVESVQRARVDGRAIRQAPSRAPRSRSRCSSRTSTEDARSLRARMESEDPVRRARALDVHGEHRRLRPLEKDPARKTPAIALKLAGYTAGGSENCHMRHAGADGAHSGWTQSSGHHRNFLGADREMASRAREQVLDAELRRRARVREGPRAGGAAERVRWTPLGSVGPALRPNGATTRGQERWAGQAPPTPRTTEATASPVESGLGGTASAESASRVLMGFHSLNDDSFAHRRRLVHARAARRVTRPSGG